MWISTFAFCTELTAEVERRWFSGRELGVSSITTKFLPHLFDATKGSVSFVSNIDIQMLAEWPLGQQLINLGFHFPQNFLEGGCGRPSSIGAFFKQSQDISPNIGRQKPGIPALGVERGRR